MTAPLLLSKADYIPTEQMPVAIVGRTPQPSFPPHTHEFNEIVLVWRGNGLHVMNDRPWPVTCGDLFYLHANDYHSYESVQDLVLDNIIYCPERFRLKVDWQLLVPNLNEGCWRLTILGMTLAREIIKQLEVESGKNDQISKHLTEVLFIQLALILLRHRYASDQPIQPPESEPLDRLMAAIQGNMASPFDLATFCHQNRLSERVLKQLFRQKTGMTIGHYLRRLQICQAKYLLRQRDLLISEVASYCGFDDSNYFSVVFTRETGFTPRAWRQRFIGDDNVHRLYNTRS